MVQTHAGRTPTRADGVFVISVLDQESPGFMARLVMSDTEGEPRVVVVRSPEGVVSSIREWLRQRA